MPRPLWHARRIGEALDVLQSIRFAKSGSTLGPRHVGGAFEYRQCVGAAEMPEHLRDGRNFKVWVREFRNQRSKFLFRDHFRCPHHVVVEVRRA